MRTIKYGLFTAPRQAFSCSLPATPSPAQITVTFGAEPVCPYGYYDYAPYNCSPDGYYGSEWFNNGVVHRRRPLGPRSLGLSWRRQQ